MRRARSAFAIALCVVLAGCGSAGGVPPGTTAGPASSASVPVAAVASDPPVAGAEPTDPPLGGTGPTDPPSPADQAPSGSADPLPPPFTGDETMVWIPAGDHRVPGTLALPTLSALPGQRVPAVLLLHGDLSSRDENGDIFARLAAALSAQGIASLRIDFAGTGDSEEPDLALDYPNMVFDATQSLDFLRADPRIDPARVVVLGLSRGGGVGATVAGTVPGVAAFVSWSGAVWNGFDEDPVGHQIARENGYLPLDFGERTFRLGLNWFDTMEQSDPLDDVAGYRGPVLAVVGSDDDVVDPEVSTVFLDTVASTDKTLHVIEGADHGFTADESYGDDAIRFTRDWLVARLG